jgi:hypothetical protein
LNSGKTAPVVKGKDLGPEPKKAKGAYNFFNAEFVKRERELNADLATTEAFKLAGKKWADMTDKDKEPYTKMAEGDKKRHEKQMAEREKKGFFLLEDKSKSTDPANAKLFKEKKKRDAPADDDAEPEALQPKRPLSAYMFFSVEYGKTLREKNTELTIGGVAQLVSEKWGTMNESAKSPYDKLNEQDKVRQQKQLAELEKKGFFVLSDGSKSTDD